MLTTLKSGNQSLLNKTASHYKQTSISYKIGALTKKRSFNINECHALSVKATDYLLTDELPFSKIFYTLEDKIIDYSIQERDLGVIMNPKFNF